MGIIDRSQGALPTHSKNGGPDPIGTKSFLADSTSPHLVDTIDFNHTPLWKDKNFLAQRYAVEGRSIAQIARETLSSKSAVREALIEFGFKLKAQGKPGLRPAQVPYGYRMSDGLMVPHLGEQRVIASVKKMVDGGLSYRKVCEFLSSVGVPTKNKGKSWQPEMVRRPQQIIMYIQQVIARESHVRVVKVKARFYMEKPLGVPKKGAGARLREFYKKLRERPLPPSEKAELIETFKKKKQSDEKAPKKIAKPPRDLELP